MDQIMFIIDMTIEYYCQWWITRLAGRGRTQLAALTGVKCRTRRALDIRTHIAAWGHPQASFVWASSTLPKSIERPVVVLTLLSIRRVPILISCHSLRALTFHVNGFSESAYNDFVCKCSTSDQARLPAEFKHINKRRKRNQQGLP